MAAREGPARVAATGTSWRSCGPRCPAGSSSCSSPGATIRPRTARPTTRTPGRRPLFGRESAPADEWVLGEDSGIEVAALGGGPGIAVGALGRRRRRAAARRARRRRRSPRALRLRARRARPGGEERRGTGILEGTVAASGAATRASATTRSSCPTGEDRTVAELGDDWKRANSTAPAPRPGI